MKGFIPLFAPLILAPVASPVGVSAAKKPDTKRLKGKLANFKIMEFDQISHDLYSEMDLQQTGLRFEVFNKALIGYYNLKHDQQLSEKGIITIVDFTKSSREKRIWVMDIDNRDLLFNTYVAHGRNSGDEFAENFSNEDKSYMSSVGFYVTQDTYYGKHGLSLKLNGLDEEHNSRALDRSIVMHGAEYANEEFIKQYGRLGRSLGCPAIPMGEHKEIIKAVMGKTTLYIHAENDNYTSSFLDHANAMTQMVEEKSVQLRGEGLQPPSIAENSSI